MLSTLVFSPCNVGAFEILIEELHNQAEDVVNYFEDNYIGRKTRQDRQTPRFPTLM